MVISLFFKMCTIFENKYCFLLIIAYINLMNFAINWTLNTYQKIFDHVGYNEFSGNMYKIIYLI